MSRLMCLAVCASGKIPHYSERKIKMMKTDGMKKLTVLLLAMLLCILASVAAGAETTGKTQVEPSEPFVYSESNNRIIEQHILYYGSSPSYSGTYLQLKQEAATSAQMAFVSGMKQAEKALWIEDEFDGGKCLYYNPSVITKEGEATFHVTIESAHYYADFDFSFVFKPRDSVTVYFGGNTVNLPMNRQTGVYHLDDSQKYVSDDVDVSYTFIPGEGVEYPEDSIKFMGGNCIVSKEGDYEARVKADFHSFTLDFPVHIHSDASVDGICVSGTPLKVNTKGMKEIDREEFLQNIPVRTATGEKEQTEEQAQQENPSQKDQDAEKPASGESALADAFMSQDDDEENEDADTSVLDSMAEEDNTAADVKEDNTDYQSMSEEEAKAAMAELIAEALQGATIKTDNYHEYPSKNVQSEVFLGEDTEIIRNGMFTWPAPANFSLYSSKPYSGMNGTIPYETETDIYWDETEYNYIYTRAYYFDVKGYQDNADSARLLYQNWSAPELSGKNVLYKQEMMLDGGYPAFVAVTSEMLNAGTKYYQQLVYRVWYSRGGNTLLYLYYSMYSGLGYLFDEASIPTIDDFMPVLSKISYSAPENREGIPEWLITDEDFAFDISAKPDQHFIAAKGLMNLTVNYRNKDRIKKIRNLQKPAWLLMEPKLDEDGQPRFVDAETATVDQNGKFKAGTVREPTETVVLAVSPNALTRQLYNVIIIPKLDTITVDPGKATLYVGESIKLSAVLAPENALYYTEDGEGNLIWSVNKQDAVSLEDHHDGTVTILAQAAGKATVTAKEITSGKKTTAAIQVLIPVTELAISGPDTVKPGSKTAFKAELKPANAGNKNVSWQINVDETVAEIDRNGKLSVKKTAESGTIIQIKCVAEGAPEEISAEKTVKIE